MRYLLIRGIGLVGLILVIIVSALSLYRRSPRSAYWIFSSEQPTSTTLFDSQQILDSNFHPYHRSQTQGEFIRWSTDADYYFVRFESLVAGQQPGLYRFHTVTGQAEFLLPTASIPHSIDMELSPDRDAFLVHTPLYRDGIGGLYVLSPDGQIVYQVDETFRVGEAQWSIDGNWVEFSALIDGQWLSFRVRPDGSQLEQTDAPPNSLIDLNDDLTVIGKMGATHESLPDNQRYFIHYQLPNNWLIIKANILSSGSLRTAPVLYRMRNDKSELRIIFEDDLERNPDIIGWEDGGNILYVAAQGDTNSLFRVDMLSGDVQMLVQDYQPVRSNCFNDAEVECPPVHLDDDFEWVIWRTGNEYPAYNITSIVSGETTSLYQHNSPVFQEISIISPDRRWLYMSSVDLQSRDCVTTRISIDDSHVETRNGVCSMAMSPVMNLPAHWNIWIVVGLISLSLSFAQVINKLRMRDPEPVS